MRRALNVHFLVIIMSLVVGCNQGSNESVRRPAEKQDARESNGEPRGQDQQKDKPKSESVNKPTDMPPGSKQNITFLGAAGDRVPGYLWVPDHAEGDRLPALLVMYGISDDKDSGSVAKAADILTRDGYVALTIDWPGTGEREGAKIDKVDRVLNTQILSQTVGDYQKAFDYLSSLDFVDSDRMGYVGASMGAMTGIAFAAQDPRVKAISAIVPIPNPLWGQSAPEQAISRIRAPVLCSYLAGGDDFSNLVCERVSNRKALDCPHNMDGCKDEVVEDSRVFFNRTLGGGAR